LIYLEHSEFRSAGVKDFAAEMQKLHNQIKEQLRAEMQNINEGLINIGENFSLNLEIKYYHT
jgi:hypothetical protein